MVDRFWNPRRPSTPGDSQPAPGGHWLLGIIIGLASLLGLARAFAARSPEPSAEPPRPSPPEIHYPDGRIEHPPVRHERSDVRFRGVLIVLLFIACFAAFHYWIVWHWFERIEVYESAVKRSPYPLAPAPATGLPAEPRLEQVDRLAGVKRPNVYVREESKEAILNSTGPTNEPGYVHIPIDEAMKRVLKDLPARRPPAQAHGKDNGLLDGGGPNSGRVFREGRR